MQSKRKKSLQLRICSNYLTITMISQDILNCENVISIFFIDSHERSALMGIYENKFQSTKKSIPEGLISWTIPIFIANGKISTEKTPPHAAQ
jgi:hypothetical protein